MNTIVLTCTECGSTNSVPAGALLATVDIDDLGAHSAGALCWICCGCTQFVTASIAWLPLLQVLSAGVPLFEDGQAVVADVASVLPPHPEHPLAGGAFTPDDQLELHELLATDTWFPTLAALASHA